MKFLSRQCCLSLALLASMSLVGCGGGGSGKTTTNPNTNVGVLIPLPTGGKSMRGSVRAAVAKDKFKAYYLNSSNKQIAADDISGLDTATATVAFMNVPPGSDLVIKSEMKNGDDFKLYYQGLVKKSELVGGTQVGKKFNSETTAKAMLFEEKKKTVTNLSIENFEYTMEQEEAKGKDVWTMLGVTSADMEKSLTDLTVEDIKSKAKTAADSLEIKEKPAPTPTTGYVDATNEKLAKSNGWLKANVLTIEKALTTGCDDPYHDRLVDGEWIHIGVVPDGGMAAEIIYSTKDGVNWTAPTDKPIIIYEEMGGSHPYCLYKNNQRVGPNQQFHYEKAKDLFRYVYYNHEKSLEEPVEKGLDPYELLDSRYFKVEEVTLDNVTYYRATNNDNAKDIYLFKLIKRPEEIFKVNPSDEVIQLDKLINATWEPATEELIQELISYKRDIGWSARVIYRCNGNEWETPTNVFLTYAEIPYAFHPWHVYVNGKHAEDAIIQAYDDVWSINFKTIAGSYKFLTTIIEGEGYLQMKNTGSDNIMTSMFMKTVPLPGDIKNDIKEMIDNSSASGNVRR